MPARRPSLYKYYLRSSSRRGGFSLHTGVACKAAQRKKLERVCSYITRRAIAAQRLSLAGHVILSPMEFIGRLVSLVPKPKGYGMSWAQRLKRVLTGRPSA
jgi:hypothetical protein